MFYCSIAQTILIVRYIIVRYAHLLSLLVLFCQFISSRRIELLMIKNCLGTLLFKMWTFKIWGMKMIYHEVNSIQELSLMTLILLADMKKVMHYLSTLREKSDGYETCWLIKSLCHLNDDHWRTLLCVIRVHRTHLAYINCIREIAVAIMGQNISLKTLSLSRITGKGMKAWLCVYVTS